MYVYIHILFIYLNFGIFFFIHRHKEFREEKAFFFVFLIFVKTFLSEGYYLLS